MMISASNANQVVSGESTPLTIRTQQQLQDDRLGCRLGYANKIRVFCPSLDKHSEKCTRFELSEHDLGLPFLDRRICPYSDNKLREKMMRPLLVSLKMYSPGKMFHAIRCTWGAST
jgi:hypothetical protein